MVEIYEKQTEQTRSSNHFAAEAAHSRGNNGIRAISSQPEEHRWYYFPNMNHHLKIHAIMIFQHD